MAETLSIGERGTVGPQPPKVNIYIVAWGLLAVAAAAYLAVLAFKPKFVTDWFPSIGRTISEPQSNEGQRASTLAEATKLRDDLKLSQSEIARLRRELAQRDAELKSRDLRTANLERELETNRKPDDTLATADGAGVAATAQTSLGGAAQSAGGSSSTSAQTAAAPNGAMGGPIDFELVNAEQTPRPPTDASRVAGSLPVEVAIPLPLRRPAAAAAERRATQRTPIAQIVRPTIAVAPNRASGFETQIETGSVAATGAFTGTKPTTANANAPAVVAFGPAVVTPSQSSVGVRLTAGPSIDALRLSWSLMTERHGAELGSLQPRYVVGNTPSAPYALIAGPVANDAEARQLCDQLIRKGIPCSVDAFNGNAL